MCDHGRSLDVRTVARAPRRREAGTGRAASGTRKAGQTKGWEGGQGDGPNRAVTFIASEAYCGATWRLKMKRVRFVSFYHVPCTHYKFIRYI